MNGWVTYLIMALAFFGLVVFAQFDKRKKVHCTFHGADKSIDSKWVKKSGKFLVHEGGLYVISPERTASMWYNPYLVFPMKVEHADYIYYSAFAWNPETFSYTDITPFSWNAIQKEKEMIDYDKGNLANLGVGEKKGILDKYLALIVIAGFAVVGYFIYTITKKVDSVGAVSSATNNAIQQLMNSMKASGVLK